MIAPELAAEYRKARAPTFSHYGIRMMHYGTARSAIQQARWAIRARVQLGAWNDLGGFIIDTNDRYVDSEPGAGAKLVALDEAQVEDARRPYCDNGCGEHAILRLSEVGLCGDCGAVYLRPGLSRSLGYVPCARVLEAPDCTVVCLAPYGVEHDHQAGAPS
jgi:hypothetical protein